MKRKSREINGVQPSPESVRHIESDLLCAELFFCSRCVTSSWQLHIDDRLGSGMFPLTRWHVTVLKRFPRPPTDLLLIIPELVQSRLFTSSFSFQILFYVFYTDPPVSHDPNFSDRRCASLSLQFVGPNWWSENGKVFRLDGADLSMTLNTARKNQPIKKGSIFNSFFLRTHCAHVDLDQQRNVDAETFCPLLFCPSSLCLSVTDVCISTFHTLSLQMCGLDLK